MNNTATKEEPEEGYESVNNPYGRPFERNALEIPLLTFHDLAGQAREEQVNQMQEKGFNVQDDDDNEDISGSREYQSDESPYDFFNLLKQKYDNVHSSENKSCFFAKPSDGNNISIHQSPCQTVKQTPQHPCQTLVSKTQRKSRTKICINVQIENALPYVNRQFSLPSANRKTIEKKIWERNVNIENVKISRRQVKENPLHRDFVSYTGTSGMFPGTSDVLKESMIPANTEKVENKTMEINDNIEPIKKSRRQVKKNPLHSDFVSYSDTSGMFPGTNDVLKESMISANIEKVEKKTKEINVDIEPIRKSERQVKKNPLHSDFVYYTGTNDVLHESIKTEEKSVASSSNKNDIRKRKMDTSDETENVSKKSKYHKDITEKKEKTNNTKTRGNCLQVIPQRNSVVNDIDRTHKKNDTSGPMECKNLKWTKIKNKAASPGSHKDTIVESLKVRTSQENLTKCKPFKVKVSGLVDKLRAKLKNPLDIEENIGSNSHVKSVLKNLKPKKFLCEYCPKAFSRFYYLKAHRMYHTKERPYKCSICMKGYTMRHQLQVHRMTHLTVKPYSCSLCGHSSAYKDKMKFHIKKRHLDIIENTDLDSFIEIKDKDLKLRMARTIVKPYLCRLCDHSSARKDRLKHHLKRIHFDITKNADLDSFIETIKKEFKLHHKTLSKENPYSCSLCDHSSTRKDVLRDHLKRIHFDITKNADLDSFIEIGV